MLNKFRQMSSSLGMKVLLTLLAATFIMVGLITKSSHKECVARVDSICINKNEFIRAKKYLLHNLNTNSSNVNQADLNKAVLNQLLSAALLRVESKQLGLVVDKSSIASEIAKIPAFHNPAGQFDKELFQRMLAANSLTETELTEQIKNDIEADMINSVILPYQPSDNLIKEFYSYFSQQRRIELITISVSPTPYTPTDAEVAEFYKHNEDKFTVPETRDISYIPIKLERYRKEAKVSDKEVDDQIKATSASTGKPSHLSLHRKEVKNSMLASQAEKELHKQIKQAEDDLAAGNTMQQVATKYGWNIHTITVTNSTNNINAPEPVKQILPETFSWSENRPSDALHLEAEPGIYYIVNVDKIHTAHKIPLEDVKQKAEAQVVAERQKSVLQNAALAIYNDMASGKKNQQKTLADHANVHVETMTVSRVDKTNLSPNLLKDIFDARDKNAYTNMHQEPERMAFQFAIVKGIIQPEPLQPGKEDALKKQVTAYMTANIQQALLSYLYSKYKVEVYPEAISGG